MQYISTLLGHSLACKKTPLLHSQLLLNEWLVLVLAESRMTAQWTVKCLQHVCANPCINTSKHMAVLEHSHLQSCKLLLRFYLNSTFQLNMDYNVGCSWFTGFTGCICLQNMHLYMDFFPHIFPRLVYIISILRSGDTKIFYKTHF